MADGEVMTAVREHFAGRAHGTKLSNVLVEAVVKYCSEILFLESVDDVPTEPGDVLALVGEAWSHMHGKPLPGLYSRQVLAWVGRRETVHIPDATAALGSTPSLPVIEPGDEAPGDAFPGFSMITDPNHPLAGVNVSDHDVPQALADTSSQRISGMRILALSVALEVGRVVPLGSVKSMVYGSNARLFDNVKQSRKAGVDTLGSIIHEKSRVKVGAHFTHLMNDYMGRRMTEEASLISAFWI